MKSYSEDIQVTGFLINIPRLNLGAFFGAEYKPGARRKTNPNRTIIAAIFLRIGASFINLGTPRGMMGNFQNEGNRKLIILIQGLP
jgi:hypothetical protein